jgi:hypothetical protein
MILYTEYVPEAAIPSTSFIFNLLTFSRAGTGLLYQIRSHLPPYTV